MEPLGDGAKVTQTGMGLGTPLPVCPLQGVPFPADMGTGVIWSVGDGSSKYAVSALISPIFSSAARLLQSPGTSHAYCRSNLGL